MKTVATSGDNSRAARAASVYRAAVLVGDGETEIHELERVEPAAGEVRVRLEGCGVCASDLPVWEGRSWFEYPQEEGASGHEGWGVIESAGAGVNALKLGDRVAVLSSHAYAECDVAPVDSVIPLPAALDGQPFPGEPLGCAINVFRRSGIEPGQRVAVVGLGFLGALLVGLAADAGAEVIAVSRRQFALQVGERMGAHRTLQMADQDSVVGQVMEWTDGKGYDCVIEATGKQGPLDLAGDITRVRGRLVVAGYHQDGPRTVNMQLWNWRGIDVINAHERDPARYIAGMQAAVEAVSRGRIDPAPLYTHSFSLDQLDAAFATLHERPDGFLKALIINE